MSLSPEQRVRVSEERGILSTERDERLLNLVNHTTVLKLFDYAANLLLTREAAKDDEASADILIDHLIQRRTRVEEIVVLDSHLNMKSDDDELAIIDEVNIALFKPIGE